MFVMKMAAAGFPETLVNHLQDCKVYATDDNLNFQHHKNIAFQTSLELISWLFTSDRIIV
jgi:hypothetical protein